jgi:Protein of unknown function (DUF4089)
MDPNANANANLYVDAAAATLGLHITAEQKPGVLMYFNLAAQMAELVQGLPLGPADESGNVFVPVVAQGAP